MKKIHIKVLTTHANFLHFKKFNLNVLTNHATHFNYVVHIKDDFISENIFILVPFSKKKQAKSLSSNFSLYLKS